MTRGIDVVVPHKLKVSENDSQHYQQSKAAMQQSGGESEEDTAVLLRQIAEHHRDHPSPARIARLTG